MIEIRIPDSFVPERSYAIHVLFDTLLGLEFNILPEPGRNHYHIRYQTHEWVFYDHFFQAHPDHFDLYQQDRLPRQLITGTGPLDGLAILYGHDTFEKKDGILTCEADLFASAFLMLSRWEEQFGQRDSHGRFPGQSSIAKKFGIQDRPVVNEYASFFARLFQKAGVIAGRNDGYQKIFTCDVDLPFYWDQQPIKKLLGTIIGRNTDVPFSNKWQSYQSTRKDSNQDPYFTFDKLMSDAEHANTPIVFYMMSGGDTEYDGNYQIEDPRIIRLMKSISERGHEIGLHGSYASATNASMLKSEKEKLESIIGKEVQLTRQHFLRHEINHTPGIQSDVGFSMDSSLGYADLPGFRCGICHQFPLFDLDRREQLELQEQPLLVMDATFLHYLKTNVESSVSLIEKINDQVKKHCGQFVFLWHNSSFEYGGYRNLEPVYNYLLSC